jgi:hypothetical protein
MRRIKPILAQGIALLAGGGQQGIQPQTLVIVQVFLAQGQPIKPLGQQLPHRMIHIHWLAAVVEALRQTLRQPEVDVHLAQEQHAPIAGERAAGEIGCDFAQTQVLK